MYESSGCFIFLLKFGVISNSSMFALYMSVQCYFVLFIYLFIFMFPMTNDMEYFFLGLLSSLPATTPPGFTFNSYNFFGDESVQISCPF